MDTQTRRPKGSISIEIYRCAYRLRWRHQGKPYTLYTGLIPDLPGSKEAVQAKANQIYLDTISGNFDATLAKYRPPRLDTQPDTQKSGGLPDIFALYIAMKLPSVGKTQADKYRAVLKALSTYCTTKEAARSGAAGFVSWMRHQSMAVSTQRIYLSLLQSGWEWAARQRLTNGNIWEGMEDDIGRAARAEVEVFTAAEVRAILDACRADADYHRYWLLLRFLFATGCRPSEAFGLAWRDLAADCSSVAIRTSLTRGRLGATKTGKIRTFGLTADLQADLQELRPTESRWPNGTELVADALVFPGPSGGALTDTNLSQRCWKSVLQRASVPYRSLYAARHTMISHCLQVGVPPATIAQMTGHSMRTLLQHYAHFVPGNRPQLPELFS